MIESIGCVFKILTKHRISLEEWESGKFTVVSDNLDTATIWDNLTLLLESVEISFDKWGESVFSRDKDLLSTWELKLSSPKSLLSMLNIFRLNSDGK